MMMAVLLLFLVLALVPEPVFAQSDGSGGMAIFNSSPDPAIRNQPVILNGAGLESAVTAKVNNRPVVLRPVDLQRAWLIIPGGVVPVDSSSAAVEIYTADATGSFRYDLPVASEAPRDYPGLSLELRFSVHTPGEDVWRIPVKLVGSSEPAQLHAFILQSDRGQFSDSGGSFAELTTSGGEANEAILSVKRLTEGRLTIFVRIPGKPDVFSSISLGTLRQLEPAELERLAAEPAPPAEEEVEEVDDFDVAGFMTEIDEAEEEAGEEVWGVGVGDVPPEEKIVDPALKKKKDATFSLEQELSYLGENSDSLLNPQDMLDHREMLFRSKLHFTVEMTTGKYGVFIKDTGMWNFDEEGAKEDEFENYLQEAFFNMKPHRRLNVELGKVNYVDGLSYAWNPTDYFRYDTDIYGPIIDGNKQKAMRPGAYMALCDWYLDPMTLTFIYSPEVDDEAEDNDEFSGNTIHQYYMKCALALFDDYNPELSFHYGDYWSYGLNWSASLGDQAVLQFEMSGNQGSPIHLVEEAEGGASQPRQWNFTQREEDFFFQGVASLNYTFKNNTTLIFEYFYHGDGYDDDELDDYYDALEYSGERVNDPAFEDEEGNNLYQGFVGSALDLYDPTFMAQHYAMIRVGKEDLFVSGLDATLAAIGASDASMMIWPDLTYHITRDFSLELSCVYYVGDERSIFGLSPDRYSATLQIIWLFG